jgi:hypothetical protein
LRAVVGLVCLPALHIDARVRDLFGTLCMPAILASGRPVDQNQELTVPAHYLRKLPAALEREASGDGPPATDHRQGSRSSP